MSVSTSPSPAGPRASIIIPNWNGLALLRPCLDSLRRQTWRDAEIIVVDNASTDASVSALAREYPEVRVLALAQNGGYSGGCNEGMRAARGEILVLLNNDIEADPHWMEELLLALDRHPEAGSAASRIMLYDRRDTLHSAGDLYRRNGTPDSRGVWQPYGPPYDDERWVFGGCGGAVAFRRSTLAAIGPFEERFFMYCEDVDLNWRAQLAGYRCIYAPEAVIYHHLSATGGGRLASYYVGRNTVWVIARNYPTRLLRLYWRSILATQWAIAKDALLAWRGIAARARLRGQVAGLLTWPRWLKARHAIQSSCRATDEYIDSILE